MTQPIPKEPATSVVPLTILRGHCFIDQFVVPSVLLGLRRVKEDFVAMFIVRFPFARNHRGAELLIEEYRPADLIPV